MHKSLKDYSILVPRADRTGPVNVAVDLGRAAAAAGWRVRLLFLSGNADRDDLQGFDEVRRFRLADLFRLEGVIHTHCLRPDLIGALLARRPGRTLITTFHNHFLVDIGFDYPRPKVRAAWKLWSAAISRFDYRVCISDTMKRYYARLLPGVTLEIAYNFRPEAAPAPPLSPSIEDWLARQKEDGQIILCYVGSLSPRKNLAPLLDAIAHDPGLSIILCGTGPQRTELESRAESISNDRVMFAGQLSHPHAVLQLSTMLVLPSLAEGFPLAVIEAARAGRQSLLSDIAIHRELTDLGFGRTFEHRDFQNFSAIVREISSEPVPCTRMHRLWAEGFSEQPGFSRYARLMQSARDS